MPSLEKLRPIAGEHSIQEAIFTILLDEPIPTPRQFKKIHVGNIKKHLPSFNLVKREETSPRPKFANTTEHSPNNSKTGKVVGFSFDNIDPKTGAINSRLRGTNDEVSWIHANILKYPGYDQVKKNILSWFRKIASFKTDMKVKAISVHYIDHLYWESKDPVPRGEVFNPSSDHIPNSLINKIGWEFHNSYRSIENGMLKTVHLGVLEQRNVKNQHTRFVIDMDLQYMLRKPRPLKAFLNDKAETGFSMLCDCLHDENKEHLRNILSANVSDMIGLNQGKSQ